MAVVVAAWVRHAIWWQVYPLGFLGAEPESASVSAPRPRLRTLAAWIDYLVELGANGLALGPVFASSTHGYDTVDHFTIDPRLGTEEDLDALIAACHDRGVRVLLDGVFNHVGRDFPAFAEVIEHGPSSPRAAWFHVDVDQSGPDGFGYRRFEGHPGLVELNHDNPEVADHVTRVMSYWCDRGVDAWRLDAAYAVAPTFWRAVLPGVRQRHPDVWVVGEMIHGDYVGYVRESGLDAVTQYEVWKAIWSSLNDRNMFELAHALRRHADLLATFLPQTFVGNHDTTRLISQLTDPRHAALALAVLFTMPGVPTVYYGDERGLRGVKEDRAGGDDVIRPAYPPDPSGLAASAVGASAAAPAALDPSAAATHDLHRHLIGVRRRNDWINDANMVEPDVLRNEIIAYRVTDPSHTLAVVLNTGDTTAELRLPLPGGHLAAGDGTAVPGDDGGLDVTVAPHSYLIVT
jgi:cyclomaltodextrinase / maltogenic alpha-amylase / neopullulanase